MEEIIWTGANAPSEIIKYVDLLCRKSKVLSENDRLREVSTQEQEKQGRAWAARNGYVVRHVWIELGSAYKDRKREEFDGALKAITSGISHALWVYMLDRFSRKGAEDVLKVIGIARVIFDWDRLDSMDDRDRERIINEAERARSYSARLSTRVTDVKRSQRDRGEWVSGWPPFGLVVGKDRHLYPDNTPAAPGMKETRAEVMQELFRLSALGASAKDLAIALTAKGVPHCSYKDGDWVPDGANWIPTTLRRWIMNPAYAGWQVVHLRGDGGKARNKTVAYRNDKGERVRVIPEGLELVSDEEQAAAIAGDGAVERSFDGATHLATPEPEKGLPWGGSKGPRERGVAVHILTTLLECANCGRNMFFTGESYVCGSQQGGRVCPAPARVTGKAIEPYVFTKWRDYVTACAEDDDLLAIISERWAKIERPEESAEAERARKTFREAENALGQLLQDKRDGLYDGPAAQFFRPAHREAMSAVREAEKVLAKYGGLRVDISFLMEKEEVTEHWEGLAKAGDKKKQRELLGCAIDRIYVKESPGIGKRFDGEKRVRIRWADEEVETTP
ncbi:recombinase family protein [Streptomyces sp. MJM1172]|uniref:recombinase family protein n=1 Tax=Streptomyces sp. MJM1172 TaxID=1703926 RepID=UPI000A57F9B7|nr:recombinase family protein [Streptomyces sp. MJM1172]